MRTLLKRFMGQLKLGDEQQYKNMIVFPILSKEATDSPFLTIDEALKEGTVNITEISELGDVPNLKLKNKSDREVFIMDGEEFIGAKQNRMANSAILAASRSELTIPVSCVERYRWNYKTKKFQPGERRAYFKLRKKVMVSSFNNMHRKLKLHPQHDVWNDIGEKINSMNIESTTCSMNDIYKAFELELDKFCTSIKRVDNQVGMIVLINNSVVSCEIFYSPDMMDSLYDKIICSYAIDAIEDSGKKLKKLKTIRRKAQSCLNEIKMTEINEIESTGLGSDIFLNSDTIYGSALKYKDNIVYMSVFSKKDQ